MTRPEKWTNRSGKTAAGGRLLRGRVAVPAAAATEGQSLGRGRLALKPGGSWLRPLSIIMWPAEWSLLGCVRERTSDQRWLRRARSGKCSQIFRPGVLVAIG